MNATLNQESIFDFDELFFSRTNLKGIIESGNSVFQRVSKYEWDELIKKPHNLIRHPDMPRGVFHLLWETILAGKQIGAYVINRSKDRSYYWVYALVSPIDEGFVSIRLKPSSPIFDIVKNKYAELLDYERDRKISPKESQEILLKMIADLGFPSYGHFMNESLTQELEHRQLSMSSPPIQIIYQLREILSHSMELQKKCEDIFSAYKKSAFIPLNLEVQASKIGQEAAPIAVISSNYDQLARQIRVEVQKFVGAGGLVQQKVGACQFDVCSSILQKEMFVTFRDESRPGPILKEVEMNFLRQLSQKGIAKAKASLNEVDQEFKKFKLVYEEVRELSAALEIVSISGKIEAAKIRQSSAELLGLLNDLSYFNLILIKSLKEIDTIGTDLIFRIREMSAFLV